MLKSRSSVNMVVSAVMHRANGLGESKTEARNNSDIVAINGQSISHKAHSAKSMDNLRSITKQYLNFVKDNHSGRVLSNVNNETIKEFITHKLDNGLSGASANTYLTEIAKMSDNLNGLGVHKTDREVITLDIRNDLKDQGHDLGPTLIDRTNLNGQAMVDYMNSNTQYGLSSELQKIAGLRADDALKIADKITINSDNSLHIAGSKNGNNYNTVQLPQDLVDRVQQAINDGYKGDYNDYRLSLKEAAEQTGNDWHGTHSLRFDFANDQREQGASLAEISQVMGHSRESITERYLK